MAGTYEGRGIGRPTWFPARLTGALHRYDRGVRLTPWEEERLLIFSAAELARRHRAAGIALNAPEAVALICDAMLEAARAGSAYRDVEAAGLAAVAPGEVLPGVRELVEDVRLEVLLEDGTRLMVLVDPLGRGAPPLADGPGAVVLADTSASARAGAHVERRSIDVRNTSRRVVRVSSHFPFDRVNPRLEFDRAAATGFRLDIDAGSSERWRPGETRAVTLVRLGGEGS
jgi:urease subunit gamma/beta